MNKNFKIQRGAQGGFTLIELIVVIVILGILAATALPKFANLGSDARVASLKAVGGSLSSASAMVHGKALVATGGIPATVSVEGTTVNVNSASGYPTADTSFATAAGINLNNSSDFVVIPASQGAGATTPATLANQIAIIPSSVAGSAGALNCYVSYTGASTANSAPTVQVTSSGC